MSATLVTQSRIASLIASLSVRLPALTSITSAPSSSHAEDVERLPLHVFRAHVDVAVEAEQRAGGRGRDAVLAGAGLRDDPALAHADGEQRLAERVVDLVRAGMREVLALEEDARAAERVRQPPRFVERRRPADVVAQQLHQLADGTPSSSRTRNTRRSAPRSARRASPARSGRRTRRSSRAHRGRGDRTARVMSFIAREARRRTPAASSDPFCRAPTRHPTTRRRRTADGTDGRVHGFRRQAAGQNDGPQASDRRGHRPVDGLARAAAPDADRARRAAPSRGPRRARPPPAPSRSRTATDLISRRSEDRVVAGVLVAVQLNRAEPDGVGDGRHRSTG